MFLKSWNFLSRDLHASNIVKPNFQSRIPLFASEIFAHEKCSDQICLVNDHQLRQFSLTRCKILGYNFVFLISADESFTGHIRDARVETQL